MSGPGPAAAIEEGRLPGRIWFYSTYACNLACTYCLTESAPGVPRRALDGATIVDLTRQAAGLGFTDVGITGGEPFLNPDLGLIELVADDEGFLRQWLPLPQPLGSGGWDPATLELWAGSTPAKHNATAPILTPPCAP